MLSSTKADVPTDSTDVRKKRVKRRKVRKVRKVTEDKKEDTPEPVIKKTATPVKSEDAPVSKELFPEGCQHLFKKNGSSRLKDENCGKPCLTSSGEQVTYEGEPVPYCPKCVKKRVNQNKLMGSKLKAPVLPDASIIDAVEVPKPDVPGNNEESGVLILPNVNKTSTPEAKKKRKRKKDKEPEPEPEPEFDDEPETKEPEPEPETKEPETETKEPEPEPETKEPEPEPETKEPEPEPEPSKKKKRKKVKNKGKEPKEEPEFDDVEVVDTTNMPEFEENELEKKQKKKKKKKSGPRFIPKAVIRPSSPRREAATVAKKVLEACSLDMEYSHSYSGEFEIKEEHVSSDTGIYSDILDNSGEGEKATCVFSEYEATASSSECSDAGAVDKVDEDGNIIISTEEEFDDEDESDSQESIDLANTYSDY